VDLFFTVPLAVTECKENFFLGGGVNLDNKRQLSIIPHCYGRQTLVDFTYNKITDVFLKIAVQMNST